MSDLLRNAIILDTETTSLRRGAGLHELAIYDITSRNITEFLLNPNLVEVRSKVQQDVTRLSSSAADHHTRLDMKTWREAIVHEIFLETGLQGNDAALIESLRWKNPFLYEALKNNVYPHLTGQKEDIASRIELFNKLGIKADLGKTIDMEQLLRTELPNHIRGKMIWIANANFESKQIGAQLGTYRDEGNEIPFKTMMETRSKSVDPFYVTGRKVNQARGIAQFTGDWSKVYGAYKEQIGAHSGQGTMVGDILDLVRSSISKGRNLQLLRPGNDFFGTSIDISHKFMATAANDKERMGLKELHRAGEDAAIHEEYVLRKSIEYNEALEHVANKTERGKALIKEAEAGKGTLHEAMKYFSLLENNGEHLQRVNLLKRFQRAYEDLENDKISVQTTGPSNVYEAVLETDQGSIKVPRVEYGKRSFTKLDKVLEYIKNTGKYSDYGIDIDKEIEEFKLKTGNAESVSNYITQEVEHSLGRVDTSIGKQSTLKILNLSNETPWLKKGLAHISEMNPRAPLPYMVGLGIIGATFGTVSTVIANKDKESQTSMLGYTYEDWLSEQEGMANQGIAKDNRKYNTDFGSPYRGPVVSNQVFEQEALLNEREKYLRKQYNATHYDPYNGLFGINNVFKLSNQTYTFLNKGENVANGYQGIRGENLKSINLSDGWNVSAEDADTINIQRSGMLNSIKSFFGMNESYSIRLAGVDAPEISHGNKVLNWFNSLLPGNKDKEAQPYGDEATARLKELIKTKNLELVYRAGDTSYGRSMGVLLEQGKDINLQMVREGSVAHLPYGEAKDAMVDYSVYKKTEEKAYEMNKGLWSTPWAQAIYLGTQKGIRPTFSTLASLNKVAESADLMSLYSMASHAQRVGEVDSDIMNSIALNPSLKGFKDRVNNNIIEDKQRNYNNALMLNMRTLMETRGKTIYNEYKYNTQQRHLDNTLSLDSLNTSNTIWSKDQYSIIEQNKVKETLRYQRKQRQAELQRNINQKMFQSPINHERMM